ncbi:MAG: restriction endonuclease [Candidatus Thorarchaeota archaeon]
MSELARLILDILGGKRVPHPTSLDRYDEEVLNQLGITTVGQGEIDGNKKVQLAFIAIQEGVEPEEVLKYLTWKDFEHFVSGVLDENRYRCVERLRLKGTGSTRGVEIDITGVRENRILAIDAKKWRARRGRSSVIAAVALRQEYRARYLSQSIDKVSGRLALRPGRYLIYPVVVTWYSEDIQVYEGVPIVPAFKLNSFLLELDELADVLLVHEADVTAQ